MLFLLLQLQLPSFAAAEADVCWSPKNNSNFDYQAKGKVRVERQDCRVSDFAFSLICSSICVIGATVILVSLQFFVQLNGSPGNIGLYSSLKHPFKSKIPRLLEVSCLCLSRMELFFLVFLFAFSSVFCLLRLRPTRTFLPLLVKRAAWCR